MRYNQASFDKWLMCLFIGLGMMLGGLSSTERGWLVIGGVVVGLTLLFGAIEVYGWIRKSRNKDKPDEAPSKLRTVLMFPVCLVIAAALVALNGTEGIVLAVLLVLCYVVLAYLTFSNAGPITLGSFTMTKPISTGVAQHDGKLFAAMTGDHEKDEETVRQFLVENSPVIGTPVASAIDALTGGRLQELISEAAEDVTLERTPEGYVIHSEFEVDSDEPRLGVLKLDFSGGDSIFSTLATALGAKPGEGKPSTSAGGSIDTAESFLARGDELRAGGQEAEARAAYEEAEARAVVDWANGTTSDRSVLPTVLIRLGKLDAARKLIAEELAKTPDDGGLLAARELVETPPQG